MRTQTKVCAMMLIVMACGCQPTNQTPLPTAKFDTQAWKDAKGDPVARQPMVDSLETQLQVGMSMEEVVELLGEPDAKPDSESGSSFIYGLGRGFMDDDEYRIIFDDDSKVKKYSKSQG